MFLLWNTAMEMEKLLQMGKEFGLEGAKLLEFVEKQQKLEQERRREEEEREEKRRQLEQERRREEEEKEEKRRQLEEEKQEKRRQLEEEREEKRRRFEEEKEEKHRLLEEDRRREDEERETRRQERELRKLEMEAELLKQKEAIEAAKREHELEIARLAVESADGRPEVREDRAKAPKLPSFVDGKDDLDAYLQRFERFAETAKWKKDGWASKLSALLSGRALEVYSRLSEDAAKDYDRVKIALMKRYDLTEDGYRRKFRASKPEVDESPEQFIVRLDRYLLRWLELSNTARSFDGLKDLIVKEVEAQCLPEAVYDLIIGNVPGARAAHDPDPSWQVPVQEACAVTTRSQAKRAGEHIPLKVPDTKESPVVDREKLKQMQRDDESLQKFWEKDDVVVRGQAETSFEVKGGVLYRVYKHPYVNGGKPLKQVMVPVQLRSRIMELAHGSIMGGHMGIKKTTDKSQSAFYWPGIQGDVTRYCKSCDVCQKTVNKGSVPKVPLEKMPLIDKPFKRVAIDLVGPFVPPSEDGHRYILTLVDFATRYPEAVPLKNIDTETVAEALVDIFSRLGVPEEILSDLGTQFVSECMKDVTRLLSIKQLTTTPYHPMCNGLTEKFNGTMKSMLKRLCSEQPRQWNRYINPLLFAYREVPQESTGFSPFELLYGRAVRGPMFILKELRTKELEEPEVKNTYQYVFELREKLEDTLKLAHTDLQKAQNKVKHYYDRKTKVRKFVPGDKVLVLLPTDHNKLLMQWKGPFEVSAVVGLSDYRVRVKGKERVYHANLLKKYFEREDPVSVGAVAVGTNANICKNEHVESEVEEVDPVDSIDFL